jgi:hypothetical protein
VPVPNITSHGGFHVAKMELVRVKILKKGLIQDVDVRA